MSITRPTSVESLPPVSDKAIDFATDMAHIELTKFRFKFGAWFIVSAVLVCLLGHFKPAIEYFTPDFPDISLKLMGLLLLLGAAFAGKDIVSAIKSSGG